MMVKDNLPIDAILPEIATRFQEDLNLILTASPGSGKTTRVPPFLLNHVEGQILVLEPRRVAARLAATRVASEMSRPVGEMVGYQFRHERRVSAKTRLIFLTEGILVRNFQQNPFLKGVSLVILDEFHERHADSDLVLSYLRKLQQDQRRDLKLLVMSATLDTGPLQTFLGSSQVLNVSAPTYPVETVYLPSKRGVNLSAAVLQAMAQYLKVGGPGDILVFLPGRREILRCCEAISHRWPHLRVLPLYAQLPMEEQMKALTPSPGSKRVVVATNIAESSLTIEGVNVVIDSGLQRAARASSWSGVSTLETRGISKASAIQRAGRAGRQGPGTCLRLFSEHEYKARMEFELPEIYRIDLSSIALELYSLLPEGVGSFKWFERPRDGAWHAAICLLERLGALAEGRLTPLGAWLISLPLPPRLGRVFLSACSFNVAELVGPQLAELAEGQRAAINILDSSLNLSATALKLLNTIQQAHSAWQHSIEFLKWKSDERNDFQGEGSIDKIVRSFWAGYPDRVAKVRRVGTEQIEMTLCFGGALELERKALPWASDKDYFIIVEAQEIRVGQQTKIRANSLLPIPADWLLESSLVVHKEKLVWDGNKVQMYSAILYGELALLEDWSSLNSVEGNELALFWRKEIFGLTGEESIPQFIAKLSHYLNTENLKAALARWRWACELNLLPISCLRLFSSQDWLNKILGNVTELDQLENVDWLNFFFDHEEEALNYERRRVIDKFLPEYVNLKNRQRVKVHYEWQQLPWLESKIQDFFGMSESPRLAEGKLAIVLHLLAPNRRAVQVTQDLAGFWQRHYSVIRQELKRRYWKHAWPEDPLKS